jgi:hypothetical protein
MTEKFTDMLPLTHEQREFLKNDDNNRRCIACFLSSTNRGSDVICGDYVHLVEDVGAGFFCEDVRDKALSIDKEYLQRHVGKDILTQDEFSTITAVLINGDNSADYEKKGNEKICSSHAALHERVAELEKLKNNLSAQIDRRDADWNVERKRFNEKIAELESRLAAYELAQMDTREEAESKAKEFALSKIMDCDVTIREKEESCEFVVFLYEDCDGANIQNTEKFPYAEPREPQPGDIMINGSGNAFTFSHYCCDDDGCSFDVEGGSHERIKFTGYRIDENEKVVPIKRGDK